MDCVPTATGYYIILYQHRFTVSISGVGPVCTDPVAVSDEAEPSIRYSAQDIVDIVPNHPMTIPVSENFTTSQIARFVDTYARTVIGTVKRGPVDSIIACIHHVVRTVNVKAVNSTAGKSCTVFAQIAM